MDGGRVAIRPLGGASAILLVSALACSWFAQTDWPGSEVLRLRLAPFLRLVDGLSIAAALFLFVVLTVLARQARRSAQTLARCRRTLDAIGEGVILLDERGGIVSVNAAMGRLFGQAAADL